MDSVRFGRVLGIGTRLAGKTLVAAVDAAAAPNPRASAPGPGAGGERATPRGDGEVLPPVGRKVVVAEAVTKKRVGAKDVRREGKRFGEAMWGPFARASGVLWLEVMGVFFGLIAAAGLQGMWAHRDVFARAAGEQGRLVAYRPFLLSAGITALFGYFCVSNFVRAARRGRR